MAKTLKDDDLKKLLEQFHSDAESDAEMRKFVSSLLSDSQEQIKETARMTGEETYKRIEQALIDEGQEPMTQREAVIIGAVVGTLISVSFTISLTTMARIFEALNGAIVFQEDDDDSSPGTAN